MCTEFINFITNFKTLFLIFHTCLGIDKCVDCEIELLVIFINYCVHVYSAQKQLFIYKMSVCSWRLQVRFNKRINNLHFYNSFSSTFGDFSFLQLAIIKMVPSQNILIAFS